MTTPQSSSSPTLIGFGTNYYHALGGTSPISLHHSDEELEVDAHIMTDPPWNQENDDTVKQVVCSTTATIFLTEQGRVYQCGTFHGRQWTSPTRVEIAYPRKCVEVAAGRHFCIGRMEKGIGVVSWGAGHFGQLGLGPHVNGLERPQLISHLLPQALGTTRVKQVAAGAWHALALLDNGKVMAWGSNRKNQCGVEGSPKAPPTLVYPQPMEFDGTLEKVACGRLHSVGLEQDTGRVYSWGASHHGQCGQYSRKTCVASPRLVEALQRVVVVDISAGDSHSLALTGGGRVFVWGSGMDGQLGLGGVVPISRPKILADLDFVAIEAGREWKQQQLESVEAAVPRSYSSSPIPGPPTMPLEDGCVNTQSVSKLSQVPKIVKIEASASYSVAVSSSGHVYTWGYNDVGQLGLPRSSTELPLVEMTSTTMKQSSSGRLLQIQSFDSKHNVLLPRRVDALAKYRITSVAAGPCHLWCIGSKRLEGEEAVVGRTLYEAQEGRRRKSMLRLREHLSSSTSSTRSLSSPLPAISSIDESEIAVFTREDTLGSGEDSNSTTTLETQPSLVQSVGTAVTAKAGELQSPTEESLIRETEPLQLPKGAATEISSSPLSSLHGMPPTAKSDETEQGKPKATPMEGHLGRGSSWLLKYKKRGSQKENNQKVGSRKNVHTPTAETREQINGPPAVSPNSPPTFSTGRPGSAGRSSSLPDNLRQSSPSGSENEQWPTDMSSSRRASFSKSVSRLMRGRRTSNPSDKPKIGRLRKGLNSSFWK